MQFNGGCGSCKFCNGQIIMAPEGLAQFIHEDDCVFKNAEYGSEEFGEDIMDGNDMEEEEYIEDVIDQEGDREVEDLKKRLERVESYARGSSARHKMRPNVSAEWIAKLREYLRVIGNAVGQAPPPQPSSFDKVDIQRT